MFGIAAPPRRFHGGGDAVADVSCGWGEWEWEDQVSSSAEMVVSRRCETVPVASSTCLDDRAALSSVPVARGRRRAGDTVT